MKSGIYNVTIRNVQLTGYSSLEEAAQAIAKAILEHAENEEETFEVDAELIEEIDDQYEDEEVEELDFDKAS